MQTKVSMVVPCSNKEIEIGNMLQSVSEQLWNNLEVILVNDGSTDGTRGIIEEWRSKFLSRGYEVVVIDQPNAGLPAAVRNGMLRMTGDYFCTVDCDDEILPGYVSTMAGWLDEHNDYEWTACNFEKYSVVDGKASVITSEFAALPDSDTLLEDYLFLRSPAVVWAYMVRVSYVHKCMNVLEMSISPRQYQEPQLQIPLAAGRGNLKYFPEVLHKYICYGRQHYFLETMKPGHDGEYARLCRQSIENAKFYQEEKDRLLSLLRLASVKMDFYHSTDFFERPEDKKKAEARLAETANSAFAPSPNLTAEDIKTTGYRVFFQAAENCILHKKNPYISAPPVKKGRVIAYGVLGWLALEILSPLMETPLCPTHMWDKAAKPGDERFGAPVTPPDFASLTKDDIILIVPRSRAVRQAVVKEADESGALYLKHFEVLDYLAAHYYARLQTDSLYS
jgi:glycosyltransferase involved in cell wall biosynthesis